jgi:hypothetical protein
MESQMPQLPTNLFGKPPPTDPAGILQQYIQNQARPDILPNNPKAAAETTFEDFMRRKLMEGIPPDALKLPKGR